MCALNFIHSTNNDYHQIETDIRAMNKATRYRGPDETTYEIKDNIGLGFNRLSIVGGTAGNQPISNHDETITLICNGEIFNHQSLQREFFTNQKFKTTSDVEIILHLYSTFGTDCLSYLEGQFAFIIVDSVKNVVFFGRDRMGINPLFYYMDDHTFMISSEMKSLIFSAREVPVKLNATSIAETLCFYGSVGTNTSFESLQQIPAGAYGLFDTLKRSISIHTYWQFGQKNTVKKQDDIKTIMRESIKKRMQGNSKIGVYLSGGLDSSIVAMELSKLSTLTLFSITFENQTYDEKYYQEIVASTIAASLITVNISAEDIIANMLHALYHCESVLTRTAPVPLFLLSERVQKEGVKFVLCGEGADELFYGYPVFANDISSFESKYFEHVSLLHYFKDPTIKKHIQAIYDKKTKQPFTKDVLIRKNEIETKLSSYLLSNQGDRLSMAHGVEQRFPFLDTEVVNYAQNLRKNDSIKNNTTKYILRDAYEDVVPQDILARKKQGYVSPDKDVILRLLHNSKYMSLFAESELQKTDIYKVTEVKKLIERIVTQENDIITEVDTRIFLLILTTQLLHKMFIEQDVRYVHK